jgi:hypothetical protein
VPSVAGAGVRLPADGAKSRLAPVQMRLALIIYDAVRIRLR